MPAKIRELVLIGQSPSRTSDPRWPLSGEPLRSRLIELLGCSGGRYDALRKTNIISSYPGRRRGEKGDEFDLRLARNTAGALLPLLQGCDVVLLGRDVARAFGGEVSHVAYLSWFSYYHDTMFTVFPHPSGVNRWWNSAKNSRKARQFMWEVGGHLCAG